MENLATFGQRIVAVIVDHIIVGIVTLIISLPFGFTAILMQAPSGMMDPFAFASFWTMWSMVVLISLVLWIVYFTYFEGKDGQTLGKKMMGIKVVAESGKMDNRAAFIRNILRIIDGLPFAYILGFIVAVASEKKQRIGDLAAKTLVVKA